MRKLSLMAFVAMSVATNAALAQTGAAVMKSEPGKVSAAQAIQITATVEAVDKAKRLVTLKGEAGNLLVVQAGDKVKNFDQIKVGDIVVAEYIEALTLELKPGGGQIRERVERENTVAAKPGEAPGMATGRSVTVIADVLAVDAQKQTIRLRGPTRTVDLKVKDPSQLKQIKVGDQIEASFTEAVGLAIEPAPKGATPATKK